MKKLTSLVLALLLTFSFAACSKSQKADTQATKQSEAQSTTAQATQATETASKAKDNSTTKKSDEKDKESTDKKISMSINGEDVIISLDDSPAANTLYNMLPLDVSFKNNSSEEKMPPVKDLIDSADKSDAPTFNIGDFGLSEDDGSLSVITGDKESENSFSKLGTVESGLDTILKQKGDFSATITKVEQ